MGGMSSTGGSTTNTNNSTAASGFHKGGTSTTSSYSERTLSWEDLLGFFNNISRFVAGHKNLEEEMEKEAAAADSEGGEGGCSTGSASGGHLGRALCCTLQ